MPIKHHSVFKMTLLVCKFLHSGHPKYIEPFLKPIHSVYRTLRSYSHGMLLEIPHQYISLKGIFGLRFAYDAPRIWNDLPDDVHSAKSLSSSKKKLKPISLQKLTHHSFLAGGRATGKVCPGCISETIRCRKFILGRDIG